jgi:fructan beta-fructosidase
MGAGAGQRRYSVGEFDGLKFTPETAQRPCDLGPNFYATQSWGDIAGQEGRRVQIAWMRDGKMSSATAANKGVIE